MAVDKTVRDLRVSNLKKILFKYKSNTEFASECGIAKAQLSRYLNKPDQYPISNEMARRIERAALKPTGWLDFTNNTESSETISVALSMDTFLELADVLATYDISITNLDRRAFRQMLENALSAASTLDGVDESKIKNSLLIAGLNTLTISAP